MGPGHTLLHLTAYLPDCEKRSMEQRHRPKISWACATTHSSLPHPWCNNSLLLQNRYTYRLTFNATKSLLMFLQNSKVTPLMGKLEQTNTKRNKCCLCLLLTSMPGRVSAWWRGGGSLMQVLLPLHSARLHCRKLGVGSK